MLYDNIMVPFDGSDSATAALEEAIRFAKDDPGLTLHIVQIVDAEQLVINKLGSPEFSGVAPTSAELLDIHAQVLSEAEASLRKRLASMLSGLMNKVVIALLEETNPGNQIVDYAATKKCDLVVMGSRGLSALRGILGSVSSFVLREADAPVLVVKA